MKNTSSFCRETNVFQNKKDCMSDNIQRFFNLNIIFNKNILFFVLSVFLCFPYVNGDNRPILCIVKTALDTPFFSFYGEKNSTCLGCLFPTSLKNDSSLQEREIEKYKSVRIIEANSDSVELVINFDHSYQRESNDNLERVFVFVSKTGFSTNFTIFPIKNPKKRSCAFIFVESENVTVLTENSDHKILKRPTWKRQNVLSHTTNEFGFLTSFTNSANANKIFLNDDKRLKPSAVKCNEDTLDFSPLATCSLLSKQLISGCYYQNRIGQGDNDVHIIDVDHNIEDSRNLLILLSGIDTLDLQGTEPSIIKSKKPLKRNLTLVLCSKLPISLAVNVKNIEGIITLLVGGNDQVENISRPETNVTISVKKVELPKSFDLLLVYVLSTVGLPISYIRSKSPSVIKMLVPSTAGIESTDLVKSAVVVQCWNDHVLISIARSIAERVGVAAMSLSDPSCISKMNDSHVFLTSTFNSCGFYLQSSEERVFYSNVVYVDIGKYSLFESDDEDFEEGSGFGLNAPTRSSQIRTTVQCKLQDKYNFQKIYPEDYNYKISLYKDQKYAVEYQDEDFPVQVDHSVHVKLSLLTKTKFTSNSDLRLLVEECWLTGSPQYISNAQTLIRKSCSVQPFVIIHTSHISQAVHFQFKLSESAHPREAQYLHCEVGLCSTNALPNPSIVKCVDPRSYCGKDSLLTAFTNQFIVSSRKNLVTGPLIVANRSRVIPVVKVHSELTHSHGYGQLQNGNHFFSTKQRPSIIVVDGLSTEAVVGIAILSFLLGIGLMGTLWFIYTKTDPGQQRRPESNVSMSHHYDIDANSGASTPSSEIAMTA